MTTMAGLTNRQLAALVVCDSGGAVAPSDDETLLELFDLGLIDVQCRLTIAGRATMPPLLPPLLATLGDPAARALVAEVEADDRQA